MDRHFSAHGDWRQRWIDFETGPCRRDVEAQRAARARALALTSAVFVAVGPSRRALAARVAQQLAHAVEGGCVVRLARPGGRVQPVAVAHILPGAQQVLRRLRRDAPAAFADAFTARLEQTSEPVLVSAVSNDLIRAWTAPEFWPYLDQWPIGSILVVPLRARGHELVGNLGLWRSRVGHAFDAADVLFAIDVARRVSRALEPRRWRDAGRVIRTESRDARTQEA